MRRDEIRSAVHKMQGNAINVEEDLATYVDGLTGLWLPPAETTQIIRWTRIHNGHQIVHEACLLLGIPSLMDAPSENVPSVWYPITVKLNEQLSLGKDPDLDMNTLGFQETLTSLGWRYKNPQGADLKRLVRDFLNIANVEMDELGEVVRKFVLKWGPLWCCLAHPDCCWAPTSYSPSWYSYRNDCRWYCSEPAILFKAKAKQAETAISIAGYLAERKHAPMELWRLLVVFGLKMETHYSDGHIGTLAGRTKHDLWVQQDQLVRVINGFISSSQGPSFRMHWSQRHNKPVMYFEVGLGFIRLVWLQIAQSLCGGKGIFKCDSCSNYYMPDRKPPEGRHHFCPACGKGKRGSKKMWARDNRKQ